MRSLFISLTVLCVSIGCSTHNILVFLPLDIWSHYIQVEPIFHALAQRGHNVTVMSPFPPKEKTPGLKHIHLVSIKWRDYSWNPAEVALNPPHSISFTTAWDYVAGKLVPEVFEAPAVQDLIHSDSKFDLIFTELFFGQEPLAVLGHIFNAPVVSYSSYGYSPILLNVVGAANAFSYITDKEIGHGGPKNLIQRLDNALTQSLAMLYTEYWYYPRFDAILKSYIPGTFPSISDMVRNVSLFFLTANDAIDGSKLYPPTVVQISGIHLKPPSSLDKEIRTIMDNAKNGVIYFSYGSIMKMSQFSREAIQTYLSVFKTLDQTVLWKTDLNASDWEIPKNVHMRKWFDQTNILAHPNCRLFLTHGGLSSTMEAIKHAVPIIGMPFYGDQILNLAEMEYRGYGLRMFLPNLTTTSLNWAVQTILGDTRFKENISRASRIFTDQPMSSLDSAVYWIEYVIRHKGAHHLKPMAAHIPWYQLFLLDVIAVFSTAIVAIFYISYKLVSILCRKLASKPTLMKEKKT